MHRHDQAVEVTNACFPNIGRRGRVRRVFHGAIMTALTLAAFTVMFSRGADPLVFALLAPLAGIAAVLFFQAREKT